MDRLAEVTRWIAAHRPERVAVLTGAGISAESGLSTFRSAGGYDERVITLASPREFERDPAGVWQWYEARRADMRSAEPNAAHRALASLESLPAGDTKIITQNIDMLHTRAGSSDVIELHGNAFRARCTRDQKIVSIPDRRPSLPPRCECGAMLRPDVVWFGEPIDATAMNLAAIAVEICDLFLIVGTSGLVSPACELVTIASNALIVEINPEGTPMSSSCHVSLRMKATAVVPAIAEAIRACS